MSATTRVPRLQHHKASGNARVSIRGRDFYLGKYGTKEASRKYGQFIAALASGWDGEGDPVEAIERTAPPADRLGSSRLLLAELVDAYEESQERTYEHRTADAVHLDRQTINVVAEFILADDAATPVDGLGPKWLRRMRDRMIDAVGPDGSPRFARKTINEKMIRTIRSMIEFGVSHELVDDRVLTRLRTVRPLKRGELGEEREGRGVSTVTLEQFKTVVEHLEARGEIQTAGLLRFMLLTGCRTQEARTLRIGDIDRDGATATIHEHKTSKKTGEAKVLPLSPACLAVIDRAILAHGKRADDAPVFRSSKGGRLRTVGRSDRSRDGLQASRWPRWRLVAPCGQTPRCVARTRLRLSGRRSRTRRTCGRRPDTGVRPAGTRRPRTPSGRSDRASSLRGRVGGHDGGANSPRLYHAPRKELECDGLDA